MADLARDRQYGACRGAPGPYSASSSRTASRLSRHADAGLRYASSMASTVTDEIEDTRYEIEFCVEIVQVELDQGIFSVESGVVAQMRIERCAQDAKRLGLDGELDRLRRLHDQLDDQIHQLLIYQLVDELDHGDRPPEHEWKWNDYAQIIADGRARGLDVRRAEEAVASAREVAASWARDARGGGSTGSARRSASPSPGYPERNPGLAGSPPRPTSSPPPTAGAAPVSPRPTASPSPPYAAGAPTGATGSDASPAAPRPTTSSTAEAAPTPAVSSMPCAAAATSTGLPGSSSPHAGVPPASLPSMVSASPTQVAEVPHTSTPGSAGLGGSPSPTPPAGVPSVSVSSEPQVVESAETTKPASTPARAMPQSASAASQRTDDVEPPEPEPLKPRFPLAADVSPEDFERHFLEVEAAIPSKLIGAATAVELWQALHQALNHGILPITGNWVDLVSVLHHRGFLPRLPSDRASRAALLILASLSPLVRRLHHRRWIVGMVH